PLTPSMFVSHASVTFASQRATVLRARECASVDPTTRNPTATNAGMWPETSFNTCITTIYFCSYGFYGFPECRECDCYRNGTLGNICELTTGECPCKEGLMRFGIGKQNQTNLVLHQATVECSASSVVPTILVFPTVNVASVTWAIRSTTTAMVPRASAT